MQHAPDFLNTRLQETRGREGRRVLLFLALALLFLIVAAGIGGFIFASSAGIRPGTIFAKLRALTLAREKMLQGEADGRINVLLLGMGGAGHEGATLTDTIIFAAVRPPREKSLFGPPERPGKVAMLSVPRDLSVVIPGVGFGRINAVNAYAELDAPGSGAQAAGRMISQILNQPIHYYLRVDFQAFREIIDTVGGVTLDVERAFYDPLYPDENFGYAPISFEAGRQTMDGERALKFVRSRHGTAGEGNDFARSRRQQKVLLALKERLISFDVLLRPQRIKSIIASLASHIQTNITFWEGMRFAKLLKDIDNMELVTRVLDDGPEGVLLDREVNGAFVLEPRDGSWEGVRAIAANLLEEEPAKKPDAPAPFVEIQNGTAVNGLAARAAERLETAGFKVGAVGNATVRDLEATLVYDLTGGKKSEEFKKLMQELKGVEAKGEPLRILSPGAIDFLVILGKNAAQ